MVHTESRLEVVIMRPILLFKDKSKATPVFVEAGKEHIGNDRHSLDASPRHQQSRKLPLITSLLQKRMNGMSTSALAVRN